MLIHAFEEGEVIESQVAAFERGREAGRQDANGRVGFLGPPIRDAEQLDVGSGINRTVAPLMVQIRLVPDLDVSDPAPVARDEIVDEIAVVEVVQRWMGAATTGGTCPFGRPVQPRDDPDVVTRGRVYDVVVLVPGRAAGGLVGILPLAPFQIGPQELLADPADTGRLGQLQGAGDTRRCFQLQAGIDAQLRDGAICNWRGRQAIGDTILDNETVQQQPARRAGQRQQPEHEDAEAD